jgi:hypothetical protein
MRVGGAALPFHAIAAAVAMLLAAGCAREPQAGDLPRPLHQDVADPLCVPPLLPTPRERQPPCGVPLGACEEVTLVVEVAADGRAGAAYIKERQSDALDACLTSAVRDWQFVPGRDCGGRAVPAVWIRHYMDPCA